MDLTITHASIVISFATLLAIVKLSMQIGRLLEQFKMLQRKVRIHDKLLGIPDADPEPVAIGD